MQAKPSLYEREWVRETDRKITMLTNHIDTLQNDIQILNDRQRYFFYLLLVILAGVITQNWPLISGVLRIFFS